MKRLRVYVLAVTLAVLPVAGCAQMKGVWSAIVPPAPRSLEQGLAQANLTLTAAYKALLTTVQQSLVSGMQARSIKAKLDVAEKFLDEAEALLTAGNRVRAESLVRSANTNIASAEADINRARGVQ